MTKQDAGTQHAIQAAARHLQMTITEHTPLSALELRPLEPYTPSICIGDITLSRLWVVQIDEQTCYVIEGTRHGQLVYVAR
jgi:hypothetical protein